MQSDEWVFDRSVLTVNEQIFWKSTFDFESFVQKSIEYQTQTVALKTLLNKLHHTD